MLTDAAGDAPKQCPACGSPALADLPAPHPDVSLLSDGRIVPRRLRKTSCRSCGLVSHWPPLPPEAVRGFYDRDYDLGAAASADDAARALNHANVVASLVEAPPAARVLEIGCGAGLVLSPLAERWPGARLLGLEAAGRLAGLERERSDRVEIRHGFVEDLAPGCGGFDLIYAINVVEHAAEPRAFLQAIARQLAPAGVAILVCPRADPPNLELLLIDHIHTFTHAAFNHCVAGTGLRVARHIPEPEGLGDFQAFVLRHSGGATMGQGRTSASDALIDAERLTRDRIAYVEAWRRLDEILASRLTSPRASAFGAGEAAALLRAYAPATWSCIDELLVDDPASARNLGKEVRPYASARSSSRRAIVLATHPRAQASLAARLSGDGHAPISWDDAIGR